jgi:hypothetical protein
MEPMRPRYILTVMLFLIVRTAGATPPAPGPNFCSHGICLEISRLASDQVKVTTVTAGLKTAVVVDHPSGTAKVVLSDGALNSCDAMCGIRLQKSHGMYVGEGCLALPQPSSERRRVTLEFEPAKELYSADFPILHIWAIDSWPVSFWASGYALRIGDGQAIHLPIH